MIHLALRFDDPSAISDRVLEQGIFAAAESAGIPHDISGTPLLQYVVHSHPLLSLPTGESHFFIPLYCNAVQCGDLSQLDNVKRVLRAMETQGAEFLHTDLHGLKFDVDTLAHEFVAEGRSTMRDIITGLLRALYRWHNTLATRWYRTFGFEKKPWTPPSLS